MVKIHNFKKEGFTLIEILVSLAVFSLILGILSEVFVSSSRSQRKTLASREILDQTSFLLEYMSRSIRMAKKDDLGDCISLNLNFEKTRLGQGIKFKNYQDICQEFYLESNILKEEKGGAVSDLTSSNLKVAVFNLGPDDSWSPSPGDNKQPKVTIFLEVQGKENARIKIQTTVAQRNLDD